MGLGLKLSLRPETLEKVENFGGNYRPDSERSRMSQKEPRSETTFEMFRNLLCGVKPFENSIYISNSLSDFRKPDARGTPQY